MAHGWTGCRTINRTVRSRRPCGQLSISISPSFKRSNPPEASAVIEQPDDPNGMGHDDAWSGLPVSAGYRRNRALVPWKKCKMR
jgi:hypothetical protein